MIRVEMPWERQNIGVTAVEYRLDSCDRAETVLENIRNDIFQYKVCRVPVNSMKMCYALQNEGFLYAESQFELEANLKQLSLDPILERFITSMDCHPASDKEIHEIEQMIRKGIFITDKIALDPFFSVEKSANRYANWFLQEVNTKNASPYIVSLDGEKIGFFAISFDTNNGRDADSFLAGLFDANNKGFGVATIYFPMAVAKNSNKKKIQARVSSNNIDSLKTHLELGYKIKNINYIYIKHEENVL
ncbi:GNAT family N-acetyltransferase [Pseudobutyrivibrio ruminis]|uniref:GNAT family N-acetyltransferase n=1 Tax=Pseudobutyrivibrio ruminis TaxID=46206 RepID=UPI0004211D33|nr:GNAT family N-acetyltransferase [Pseudobutyrivibrio ruminis]